MLVSIDTLRADALGAYGQRLGTSPHIDRLAAEGVLFEQCSASAPSTLPSHSSILTGREPFSHGARANAGFVLPRENATLAEVLRDAGFATGAEVAAAVISRRSQLDQGFDHYRDTDSFDAQLKSIRRVGPAGGQRYELPERNGRDITRRGIEFLRRHRERPFFLFLHYFDPHAPYAAPEEFASRIPESRYHAEVLFTDSQVGRLVSALEKLGLAGRTLLVLTSDHGEALGEHGEETHSYFVYQSTIHVPLIFWGPPELASGTRVATPVRGIDIAPTVLDWLGLPPLQDVQGLSLWHLLEGRAEPAARTAYGETLEPLTTFQAPILRFLREGRWKYIHKVNPELYDLDADPAELTNRFETHPDVAQRLEGRLREVVGEAPAQGGQARVTLDEETLAQLNALGYVGAATAPELGDELASLDLSGVDITAAAQDIRRFGEAWGLISSRRDVERSIEVFQELLGRYPDSIPIIAGLVRALTELERSDEVVPLLRRAVELDPAYVPFRVKLATLLSGRGEVDEAESLFVGTLEREPCSIVPRVHLASMLGKQGDRGRQIQILREGIERCDAPLALQNDYAYALATTREDELRDGAEALRIATYVVSKSGDQHPAYLDTLAAAQAETGDFDAALVTSRRALAVLNRREMPEEVVAVFRGHLETLEAGEPIREP